jgi:hypothetical protein
MLVKMAKALLLAIVLGLNAKLPNSLNCSNASVLMVLSKMRRRKFVLTSVFSYICTMHKLKILDECTKKLDKCDRPTTTCQNTAGSYKCICNKGMNYVPENNTMCEDFNGVFFIILFCFVTGNDLSGSVVECSPATWTRRVRFPA